MGWVDDFKGILGDTRDAAVTTGRAILAGVFDAAAGRVAPAISDYTDAPEQGPVYGLDPGGVTRTDGYYYDATGRLVQREYVGVPGTNLRYPVGEYDSRNAPNVAANAGSPETLSTIVASPLGLAIIAAAVVGGVLLVRK